MSINTYKEQLKQANKRIITLRNMWKAGGPKNRPTLELQARCYKKIISMLEKKISKLEKSALQKTS